MKKIFLLLMLTSAISKAEITLGIPKIFKLQFGSPEKVISAPSNISSQVTWTWTGQGIAILAGLISSLSANLIKQIYDKPDYMSTPISLGLGMFMIGATYKTFNNPPSSTQMITTIITALCAECLIWQKLSKKNNDNKKNNNYSDDEEFTFDTVDILPSGRDRDEE